MLRPAAHDRWVSLEGGHAGRVLTRVVRLSRFPIPSRVAYADLASHVFDA